MQLHHALDRPGAAAWLEDARSDRRVLRSDLPEVLARWRGTLVAAGAAPGAVVGLRGRDPLTLAQAWLGVLASGRCVAPLGPDVPAPQLARWHRDVQPQLVLDADEGPQGEPVGGPVVDGEVLLASSGTTGPPKLVRLRADQLLHTASGVARVHRLDEHDRGFNPLPLHHVNAEVVGLLTTLLSGGTLVLDDRFHRTGVFELLAQREITWLNGVPAVLALLLRGDPPAQPLPRLRFVRSASAPLPAPVREGVEALLGVPVVETYGMTEAGSQITANDLDAPVPGSAGRAVGVDLRVADDEGRPLPAGEVGKVQIRGAGVITGYASDAGNEALSPDGWLDTGDLGRLDATGSLFLAGRRDDIINRGGEKVFPRAVEDVLLADPRVRSAAVVGWPDDVLGEVPVAALALDPAVTAGQLPALLADLDAACTAALDRTRRPVRYSVLPELPGGVNGKISRSAVRALLSAPDAPEALPAPAQVQR